jgi:hypothetical protein
MMAAASAALSIDDAGPTDRAASPPGFRAFCAILVVLAFLTAGYGLYWDIQWHEFVGRDSFFIPPHLLLYAGIAVAGIATLLSILYESVVRNRHNGSVSFLWLFRGARGMFVTGFGVVFIVLAAPLDDYWHRLYGLDATIWAPFHLMGLFGSLMAMIGIVYTLAGLANAARRTRWKLFGYNFYEWLIFLQFAALISLSIVLAQPAMRQVPQVGAGPFVIYPAMLIWSLPTTLWTVTAIVYARTGGAAITLLAVWFLRSAAFSLTVPILLQHMVVTLGLAYRNPNHVPHLAPMSLLLLLALAPGVLALSLAGRRGSVSLTAGAIASVLIALGAGASMLAANGSEIITGRGLSRVAIEIAAPVALAALPVSLLVAAIGGAVATWLGRGFGKILEAE